MLTEKLFSSTLLTVSEIPSIAIDPFLQTYFCSSCGNSKINSDDFFNTVDLSNEKLEIWINKNIKKWHR